MAQSYAEKIANAAQKQFDTFAGIKESQPPLQAQIARYWSELGLQPQDVNVPWGGIFVSWCVKQAGVPDFAYGPGSAQMVHKAIKNSTKPSAVTRAVASSAREIRAGDIIQMNRTGNTFDFAHASANSDYPSHLAIAVETGADNEGRFVMVIRGNMDDEIRRDPIRLDAQGRLPQEGNRFIAVVYAEG